jgi:3-oxoacyl-[acyl-carrier protein] reductase
LVGGPVPRGDFAQPLLDVLAALVAYLARKESGYMTGSSLTIDGGMAL